MKGFHFDFVWMLGPYLSTGHYSTPIQLWYYWSVRLNREVDSQRIKPRKTTKPKNNLLKITNRHWASENRYRPSLTVPPSGIRKKKRRKRMSIRVMEQIFWKTYMEHCCLVFLPFLQTEYSAAAKDTSKPKFEQANKRPRASQTRKLCA